MSGAEAWEAVIGLEVHAELMTSSKVFCACSASFGASPNTNICPVCTGMPGVLPVLNRRVVEWAVLAGLAANCEIARVSRWARKNYFYPDLPKGYQISQYELPICRGGWIEVRLGERTKRVGLTRIHMEEDTGKNIHEPGQSFSLVDFNRCGVPLLEIVSEPEISSPEEAGAYLRSLRSLLQYLEICDGNMEEGSLRCDANVSVRRKGERRLGVKTEIKNMNSFKAVERALAYEIERQIEAALSGGEIVQETRLWDPEREETRSMRTKEFAHDYRYFPEPDLPPISVDDALVERMRSQLPELPEPRRARFIEQYGLPPYDAEVLTARRDLADYFEAAVAKHGNPKAISNWVMGDILRLVRERRLDESLRIRAWPVAPEALAELVGMIDEGRISGKIAKVVFEEMVSAGGMPREIVEAKGLAQVSDENALERVVEEVLASHQAQVEQYRAGREQVLGFLVGQVMKMTRGQANPKMVNEILRRRLRA